MCKDQENQQTPLHVPRWSAAPAKGLTTESRALTEALSPPSSFLTTHASTQKVAPSSQGQQQPAGGAEGGDRGTGGHTFQLSLCEEAGVLANRAFPWSHQSTSMVGPACPPASFACPCQPPLLLQPPGGLQCRAQAGLFPSLCLGTSLCPLCTQNSEKPSRTGQM